VKGEFPETYIHTGCGPEFSPPGTHSSRELLIRSHHPKPAGRGYQIRESLGAGFAILAIGRNGKYGKPGTDSSCDGMKNDWLIRSGRLRRCFRSGEHAAVTVRQIARATKYWPRLQTPSL
jgi:hypothetical protein